METQMETEGRDVCSKRSIRESVFPPAAEQTHVSSVVTASAALPSPWMDSKAVE